MHTVTYDKLFGVEIYTFYHSLDSLCAVIFEKSQRSVTHDFLRYINILTYLLTYLLTLYSTCWNLNPDQAMPPVLSQSYSWKRTAV